MLSSTLELIVMAASNSHIIFCFCNFIIAILLLGGFKPSSEEDTTNILDHDMSKRKEALGIVKPKRVQKGMSLDCEVRNMNAICVTSQEMHTFSVSSDTSVREVLLSINQDNKSGTYIDASRFPYYEYEQSHHQDTSFKCESIEGASANGTIDRMMYLEKPRKEADDNNFEKCDEKEDDELRKRIEDFIEKVNRGWRAEKLGICYQSQ